MSSTVPDNQADPYAKARRRVRGIRGFSIHAAVFAAVNILLHVINFVATLRSTGRSGRSSAGVSVSSAHGLATYRWMPFLGKEWEKRKIRELMNKDRRDA